MNGWSENSLKALLLSILFPHNQMTTHNLEAQSTNRWLQDNVKKIKIASFRFTRLAIAVVVVMKAMIALPAEGDGGWLMFETASDSYPGP